MNENDKLREVGTLKKILFFTENLILVLVLTFFHFFKEFSFIFLSKMRMFFLLLTLKLKDVFCSFKFTHFFQKEVGVMLGKKITKIDVHQMHLLYPTDNPTP